MQLDLLAAPSARRFDPQTSRDAAESARFLRSAGPASPLIVSVRSAAEHLHDDGLEAEYGR